MIVITYSIDSEHYIIISLVVIVLLTVNILLCLLLLRGPATEGHHRHEWELNTRDLEPSSFGAAPALAFNFLIIELKLKLAPKPEPGRSDGSGCGQLANTPAPALKPSFCGGGKVVPIHTFLLRTNFFNRWTQGGGGERGVEFKLKV